MHFNKRGQELSTNTVIILVLAVLVLVFIIIGFSVGWNRIFPFISPPNNVKDVADKCGLACSTQDQYGFCSSKRDMKIESEISFEVPQVGNNPKFSQKLSTKFQATCAELTGVSDFGIPSCSAIVCTGEYVYNNKGFVSLACEKMQKTGAVGLPKKLNYLENGVKTEYQCDKPATTTTQTTTPSQ